MPSFSPVPRLSKSARRTFNQRKDWFIYLSSASWPNTSQARRDGNTEGSSLLTMFSACGRRTPISPRFHVGVAVRNKVSFPQQVREIACQVACFCKLPCHYHPGRHDVKQVVNSPGTESKAVLFSGNRPGHFAARKIFFPLFYHIFLSLYILFRTAHFRCVRHDIPAGCGLLPDPVQSGRRLKLQHKGSLPRICERGSYFALFHASMGSAAKRGEARFQRRRSGRSTARRRIPWSD